jgi:ACS family hexuronate transporter-like MFS transporter
MLLVSLISYIDRNTLALLAPTILKETGLSGQQYGLVISAFSIAYMAGNPLWGRALDRFGLRPGMMAAVSFWSLASAAHALAGGFASLAAAACAPWCRRFRLRGARGASPWPIAAVRWGPSSRR